MSLLFIAAWFVQMGVHEGAHAYTADALGDDTAALQGKRSFNPIAHIDFGSLNSLLMAVVVPVGTALMGMVPMGMAWVPINPLRLKRWRRDVALISVAGPGGNFVLAALCLAAHAALARVSPTALVGVLDDLSYAVYLTTLVYGIFNLVPVPPLDGSKVLYYFLPNAGRELMDSLAPYGMMILFVLFYVGPASQFLSLPLGLAGILWGLVAG